MTAHTRQHPTQPQITKLYTVAGQAGLDHAGVKDELFARYGLKSTKDLSLRQFEQFLVFFEGMARQAQRRPPTTKDDPAHPKCSSRADCERLLRSEWPLIFTQDPDLAGCLVSAFDCFRLTRLSGKAAESILAAVIQTLAKADLRDIRAKLGAYLTGYTNRNERYFLGMVRTARLDRRLKERREAKKGERQRDERAGIDQLAEEIISRARLADQAGEPMKLGEICACDGKGKLWYQPGEGTPMRVIPCPWCEIGRRELAGALGRGQRFDHINWRLVREQTGDRLRRWAAESEDGDGGDTTEA